VFWQIIQKNSNFEKCSDKIFRKIENYKKCNDKFIKKNWKFRKMCWQVFQKMKITKTVLTNLSKKENFENVLTNLSKHWKLKKNTDELIKKWKLRIMWKCAGKCSEKLKTLKIFLPFFLKWKFRKTYRQIF